MSKQIDLLHYTLDLEADATPTPSQEYLFETGKSTYWQDSEGKPYRWWRNESEG